MLCVFIYYDYYTTVYTDVCVRVLCVWPRVLISSEFDQQGKFFFILPRTFLLYFPPVISYF